MEFLSTVSHTFIDFLFPKSDIAKSLEALSGSQMLNLFPSPRHLDDDRVIALFDYQDSHVRDLIWEIKYKGNRNLAKNVSEVLYELLCQEIADRTLSENFINPILIPMPISDKKRRERGFNQTELICNELELLDSEHLFVYMPEFLKKIRHTESQSHTHTKTERMENLRGSMKVIGDLKPQRYSVVLIDDVITTGASIAEARRALREAGLKKVLAITLAH